MFTKNLWYDFLDYARAGIARNAKALTVLTVLMIVFAGLMSMLLATPSVWVTPLVLYIIVSAVIIFASSVKAVVKSTIAVIFTLIVSSASYVLGAAINPYDSTALLWFFAYWILLCGTLAYSYIVIKATSRWNAILASLFTASITSYTTILTLFSSPMAALTTILVGTTTFAFLYGFSKGSQHKNMPVNVLTDVFISNLKNEFSQDKKWNIRIIDRGDTNGVAYVFNQHHGFLLYPVWLEEKLSVTFSRRGKNLGLGYKGTSVNTWLLETALRENPTWKTNGAQLFPVFLNLNPATKDATNIINTTITDMHHVYPVGFMDGSFLTVENNRTKLLPLLEKHFGANARELKPKQYQALLGIGARSGVATTKQ